MSDDELENLLNQWSRQTRLDEPELSAMLAPIAEPPLNPAAPWINFWQQIGQLIRIERQLAGVSA